MQHSGVYAPMWDGNYTSAMPQLQQYQQAMAAVEAQRHMFQMQTPQQQMAPHAYMQQQPPMPPQQQPYMASVMHASPAVPADAHRPSSPIVASSSSRELDVSYTPASHGYAALLSETARHIIRSKHVQLGRDMGQGKGSKDVVGISSAKNISRVHATLGWEPVPAAPGTASDPSLCGWVITCVGKNGLHHEGDFKPQHAKFTVRHKDRLQIGETVFFFIEPKRMNADMINTQAMQ